MISYLLCGAEVVLCCFGFLLSQVIVTVVLMVPYVFAKITLFLAKGLDSIEAGTELARLLNEDFIPNNTPWISILSAALAVGVMLLIMRKLHPPFTDWLRMKKAPLSSFVPVAPLAVGLQILISLVLGLVPAQTAQLIGIFLLGLGYAPIYPSVIHSTPAHFGAQNSQALIGLQMASAYVGTCILPPAFGFIGERFG